MMAISDRLDDEDNKTVSNDEAWLLEDLPETFTDTL